MYTWINSSVLRTSPILLSAFLVACGGGGGNSLSDGAEGEQAIKLTPGGYTTEIEYEDGSTEEAITFISATGKFVTAVYTDSITTGTLRFGSNGAITGSGTDVAFNGDSWESINGTLTGNAS